MLCVGLFCGAALLRATGSGYDLDLDYFSRCPSRLWSGTTSLVIDRRKRPSNGNGERETVWLLPACLTVSLSHHSTRICQTENHLSLALSLTTKIQLGASA